MGLNLKKRLLEILIVHDDLNTAWFVWLINTGEEGVTVVEHLDLIQIDTVNVLADFLATLDLADTLVLASRED